MIKKFLILAAAAGLVLAALLGFRYGSKREAAKQSPFNLTASNAQPKTPGDRLVITAQSLVEREPEAARGYNMLAAAYMQKARETGDFSLNAKAEEALSRAEVSEPGDYEALKLRAKLLLTFHRFAEALEVARRAQSLNPRDHDNYGALADALVELGDYDGAVKAAQTMVDLRPDTASYSRVSYLRELHGDTKGAIDAMRMAVEAASPKDPEGVAWCRVHLGDALVREGNTAEAEREYDHALFVFPEYHVALAAKARARLAAGDADAAVQLYRRAIERVPLPDYAAALGDLLTKLGRADEARRQYELVEFVERTGAQGGTYTRQLAMFWADHDTKLDDALAVARSERAARSDIYTADLLAWCLYKKGRYAEAKAAMDEALRLGTRDPKLLFHAGMIADALGDRAGGAKYLRQALAINPSFDVLQADAARRALAGRAA
ncbi:MAG TPA: tetratricopeptide repeat protein [Pyrinomonadaceae bacterium]|jgi:tetratricopeptide (TPR) repeat protein|nr:tetratricopeptide repeat protein [Pyrinomonadaceae bacterium]